MKLSKKKHKLQNSIVFELIKITKFTTLSVVLVAVISFTSCKKQTKSETIELKENFQLNDNNKHTTPEYFLLRPEVEKAYGYSHTVKIGNDIKISGAVSIDDEGNPTAVGDFEQQLKNCYSGLEKILNHYKCKFDDVVAENVFTTNMPKFLEFTGYRSEIYKQHVQHRKSFITHRSHFS